MACGEERFQELVEALGIEELYGFRGRSHDVRDVGTLLSLWKDTPLYGGNHRTWDCPCGDRDGRS